MRTLNRPMFNMGGPIKQGIMQGIREPYRGGGAALVGNPVYPRTGGREHHNVWKTVLGAGPKAMPHIRKAGNIFKNWMGKTVPVTKTVPKQGPTYFPPTGRSLSSKGYPGGKITGKTIGPGSSEVTEQIFKPGGPLRYLAASPEGKAVKWIWDGKGWVAKAAAMPFKSPLVGGYLIYKGGQWLTSDGSPATDEQIAAYTAGPPGGGDPGMTSGKLGEGTAESRVAFAKSQRDQRVQKYMDLMGYDRSKKTAIADALIDASKIVSDRGTLDTKNITGELINPAIQALSKRLDKPEQIREAVGLMMTKAGLEKEMYDAKPGQMEKNVQDLMASGKKRAEAEAIVYKQSKGAIADMQSALATDKVSAAGWPSFVMSTGAQHGEEVTQITDEELKEKYKDEDKIPSGMDILTQENITDDGIYIIGQETIVIKGGKKIQIKV